MTRDDPTTTWRWAHERNRSAEAGRRARHLRDHGRPREGDDLPLAVPARGARAARLPDRRRRGRRLDASTSSSSARASRSSAPARSSTRTSSSGFATRLSYVAGDFSDAATYDARRRGDRGRADARSSISRSRRCCSARSSGASPTRGLTKNARVVVEKPFGHDLRVRPRARRRAAPVHRRVAALPDRPLPREDGPRGDHLPAVREHDARAGLEPELRRVACRSRWRRTSASRTAGTSTTRSARCATSWSTTSCRSSRPPRWSRPRGGDPETLKDAQVALFRAIDDRRPGALRPRPVRRLPRHRRRRAGLDDRDVRRAPPRHRELALVGRAVLHPRPASGSR